MGTHVHMYLYIPMHACIQIPHTHSHTREWINMSSALCHTMDIIDRLLLHVSWWKEVFYRRSRRSKWTVSYRLSNLHLPWWSTFKISLGFQVFKDDLTFSYSFFLLFCLFVLFLSFIYFCFMCMGFLPAHVSVNHMCVLPVEARRGQWVLPGTGDTDVVNWKSNPVAPLRCLSRPDVLLGS